MTREVRLHAPGVVPYGEARDWQQGAACAVSAGDLESLVVLQHTPVYTLGRRANPANLLLDAASLALRGAEVVQSDRGGDVTFHGPGQLVAYPILDLRARNLAAADYVRLLEDVVIRTAEAFGVEATRSTGRPGVWAGDAKLGAIGVRIQRGVSLHGLALNVNVDLSWFDAIVPCGLSGVAVT
ncbi:MAG TPA: lipoyl(octanoyl) transferase LipB [Dehalococcoidia bacterium]|nr:lipoyl(octanoyl) transferase LipB [Dehalococcoidia bacterium]